MSLRMSHHHLFNFGPRALVGLCAVAGALLPARLGAQSPETDQQYRQMVDRAVDYLQRVGQDPEGAYTRASGPAVTSLVVAALLRHGYPSDDPFVARSLKYLEGMVQPDGGVYQTGSRYRNYETCVAIMCFTEANADGRYNQLIERADAFVKRLQWDEGEEKGPEEFEYGGAGYGSHNRPDLSNTSFLIDALRAAGNDENSEAIQKALVFVSRCQNYESEHNTTPFAALNPDGGFYYTCAAGGASMAGATPEGGLRSYGSMTYAGLKSMIYAGVDSQDGRVKAAVEWVRRHYALDSNPGMGAQGLYYYYHTFAKALNAMGSSTLVDADGNTHDWRAELIRELARRQRPDGSWVNDAPRWLEGDPNLVTAYALLALSYCRPVDEPDRP